MGMIDVIKKRWRYFTAKTDSRFEESADPKIQLEQGLRLCLPYFQECVATEMASPVGS